MTSSVAFTTGARSIDGSDSFGVSARVPGMDVADGLGRGVLGRKTVALLNLFLLLLWVITAMLETSSHIRQVTLPRQRLRFSSPGSSFKVAIIADLHYGENAWTDWGPAQDVKSTAVQDFVLDTEQPGGLSFLGLCSSDFPVLLFVCGEDTEASCRSSETLSRRSPLMMS